MSQLLVIRHAQASFMSDNYDQLSALGHQQSAALGAYLVKRGIPIDHAIVGPLQRHRETAEHVKNAFQKAGHSWSESQHVEFDEHRAPEITRHFVRQTEQYPDFEELDDPQQRRKAYFRAFNHFFRKWVCDELDLRNTNFERWEIFKNRVIGGLEGNLSKMPAGSTVALFTSGGPAGVITGHSLQLQDEKMMELSWQVQNTSFSTFLFSPKRFSLKSFNEVPHLSPEQVTLV